MPTGIIGSKGKSVFIAVTFGDRGFPLRKEWGHSQVWIIFANAWAMW